MRNKHSETKNPKPGTRNEKRGVLLMAYGGPLSLDEVEPYLLDVRQGRPTSREFLEEVRQRYRAIGGRSPLLEITRAQAAQLQKILDPSGGTIKVYVGMRHWHPFIRAAVETMSRDNVKQGVGICMAPQYSTMSTGAYISQVEEARRQCQAEFAMTYVKSWCDDPGFLDALAAKIRKAINSFPDAERSKTPLLLTAHSLPLRILEKGDPYPREMEKTVAGLVKRLQPGTWRFAYQSAGQTTEPWLGPDASQVLVELAAAGYRGVVIAPVGFVADNVEILYDIDVVYQQQARNLGMRLRRSESLNASSGFIRAVANLLKAHSQTTTIRPYGSD